MRFVPNPRAIALLGATPEMVLAMKSRAEAGIEESRAIAPVVTGEYRDGLVAEAGIEGTPPTAKGRMNAKKFTSGWIEFGTSRMAAQAVLRRGAEAAGLKLSGKGAQRAR
jgi:hypothetical protein